MGYDSIVLNSMSRFYHEKLNANFGQDCTLVGNGELGMTARNMGVGDRKMMEVLIEVACYNCLVTVEFTCSYIDVVHIMNVSKNAV